MWVYFPAVKVVEVKMFKKIFSGSYIITAKVREKNFRLVHVHDLKPLRNMVHIDRLKPDIDRTVVPPLDQELEEILETDDVHEELVDEDQDQSDHEEQSKSHQEGQSHSDSTQQEQPNYALDHEDISAGTIKIQSDTKEEENLETREESPSRILHQGIANNKIQLNKEETEQSNRQEVTGRQPDCHSLRRSMGIANPRYFDLNEQYDSDDNVIEEDNQHEIDRIIKGRYSKMENQNI